MFKQASGIQQDAAQPTAICPYCSGPSLYLLSSRDINRKIGTDSFDFYRCSTCDLMFLHPIPDNLRLHYQGGYQRIPRDLPKLRAIAKAERYRMAPILRHKTEGSLLEIGPWMGIFSSNAKDAGFKVTAVEIASDCVAFLNDIVGIEAIQSAEPAAAIRALNRRFDVIALWHSLEHLPNPWTVLEAACAHLAPGGILLIAVPNIESYDFSVLQAKWVHLDAPRHLYFFTADWLEKLCTAAGLRQLEVSTSDDLGQVLSRIAWSARARHILPIKYLRGALGILLNDIARRKGRGDTSGLTAIFVKS